MLSGRGRPYFLDSLFGPLLEIDLHRRQLAGDPGDHGLDQPRLLVGCQAVGDHDPQPAVGDVGLRRPLASLAPDHIDWQIGHVRIVRTG